MCRQQALLCHLTPTDTAAANNVKLLQHQHRRPALLLCSAHPQTRSITSIPCHCCCCHSSVCSCSCSCCCCDDPASCTASSLPFRRSLCCWCCSCCCRAATALQSANNQASNKLHMMFAPCPSCLRHRSRSSCAEQCGCSGGTLCAREQCPCAQSCCKRAHAHAAKAAHQQAVPNRHRKQGRHQAAARTTRT